MQIKLKYSNILFFLIIIIIISECNGFRLIALDDNVYKGIYLLTIITIFFICLVNKNIISVCKSKFIYNYIILLSIFLVFEYSYITYVYGSMQTIYEFINRNKHYLFVIISLPLLYVFIMENSVKKVMDSVLVIVTITLGLMFLHAVLKNQYGVEILNISKYSKEIFRNGRFRMWDLSSLEGLAIIYAAYQVIYGNKRRVTYFIQATICIASLIYVEQTRVMLIAIFSDILLMLYIKRCKTVEGFLIKGLLTIFFGLLCFSLIIPKLLESFSLSSSHGYSTSVRLVELQLALNLLSNKGIFGIGMISVNLQKYLFYHGVYSSVSLDDIGLLGYTVQAGIWSIFLFILPMFRMLAILIQGNKNNFKFFLFAIYIYLIITSISLFVLDSQRILMWPFCLALFEFFNMERKKEIMRD